MEPSQVHFDVLVGPWKLGLKVKPLDQAILVSYLPFYNNLRASLAQIFMRITYFTEKSEHAKGGSRV